MLVTTNEEKNVGKVTTPNKDENVHCELKECLSENVDADVAASIGIICEGSVNGVNCQELMEQMKEEPGLVLIKQLLPINVFNAKFNKKGIKTGVFDQVLNERQTISTMQENIKAIEIGIVPVRGNDLAEFLFNEHIFTVNGCLKSKQLPTYVFISFKDFDHGIFLGNPKKMREIVFATANEHCDMKLDDARVPKDHRGEIFQASISGSASLSQLKLTGFSIELKSFISLSSVIKHCLKNLLVVIERKDIFCASLPVEVEVTTRTVLEALSTEKCIELISLERLESISDIFLELVVDCHLFLLHDLLNDEQFTMSAHEFVVGDLIYLKTVNAGRNMAPPTRIGFAGLVVIGQNLALNISEKGFPISVYNRTTSKVDETVERAKHEGDLLVYGFHDPEYFIQLIQKTRVAIKLVKVGSPFDQTIKTLSAYMEKGECIFDGGNEWYENIENEKKRCQGWVCYTLGWESRVVKKVAAQVLDSGPCVTYIGKDGSGNFVKMVHNRIEYGDMQLIAEAYDVLKSVGKLSNEELHNDKADGYLVDKVLDKTGMKATGKWTIQQAVDLSVVAPTMAASLDSSYAQGMNLIRAKSIEKGWDLKLGELARIWKGSCIIQTILLDKIKKAYDRNPELANLPVDPKFAKEIIDNVYLSDLSGTRYFATKIIDKTSPASRKKLSGAQTENEIMQLLDHPFLPTEEIMEEEPVSLIHEHKLDMRENLHQWAVAIKVLQLELQQIRNMMEAQTNGNISDCGFIVNDLNYLEAINAGTTNFFSYGVVLRELWMKLVTRHMLAKREMGNVWSNHLKIQSTIVRGSALDSTYFNSCYLLYPWGQGSFGGKGNVMTMAKEIWNSMEKESAATNGVKSKERSPMKNP
ncbi:hypothetical protein GQ457_09G013500 [Hibiscus cannabinus]